MDRGRLGRCGRKGSLALIVGIIVTGTSLSVSPAMADACYGDLGIGVGPGWNEQCAGDSSPEARFGAAMAEMPDPKSAGSSIVVLFGGCGATRTDPTTASFADGTTATANFGWCPSVIRDGAAPEETQNVFDDTWIWEGYGWRKVARPSGAPAPHARWGASMAFDRTSGKLVLFGGLYQTTDPTQPVDDADAVNCWGSKHVQPKEPSNGVVKYRRTPITSVTVPTGAYGASQQLSSLCFADTWLFDGTSWARATSSSRPPARFEHAMSGGRECHGPVDAATSACGPRSGLATVFSGCGAIGMVGSHGRPDLPVYWDCSTYAGAESLFTITNPVTGEVRERKVTVGDTWVWGDGSWEQVCPGPAANGACSPVAGASHDCSTPRVGFNSISLCSPSARRGATMTYNPATGGTLLFGGYTYDAVWEYRGHKGDTWEWDADSSCPDLNDGPRPGPCWRLLMADWKAAGWTTPLPGPRGWSASTAAGIGGQWRVVMFGGEGYSRFDLADPAGPPSRYAEPLQDTWVWLDGVGDGCTDGVDRYDTTCWQPCPTCVGSMPERRAAANLAYDSGGGEVVLFGGACGSSCGAGYASSGRYANTWTFIAPPPVV